MKTLKITLLLLLILIASVQAQEKSADQKIIEGIYQEEVTGDLDKAEKIYQDVLKNCGEERVICARALYHLGLVAEKRVQGLKGTGAQGQKGTGAQGQKGTGAEVYYARLIEKYPEVGDYAELARGRLAKLKDANTFVDPRDGHKYRWVKIGNQIWMAENLAYMPHVNPPKKQEYGIWVYDYDGENVAEAKATENYQKYGCLYDWPTAMALDPKYLKEEWNGDPQNQQGLCPAGWRMPSDKDWMGMEHFLGMPDSVLELTWDRSGESIGLPPVGKYLRSPHSWLSGRNGSNSSGFNALPAGSVFISPTMQQQFNFIGYTTGFWTATSSEEKNRSNPNKSNSWYRSLLPQPTTQYGDQDEVNRDIYLRGSGYSIRCIKGEIDHEASERSRKFIEELKLYSSKKRIVDFSDQASIQPTWHSPSKKRTFPQAVPFNDRLIFSSEDSLIHCVDKASGRLIWEKRIQGIGYGEIVFTNNLLYGSQGPGGPKGTKIYAINPQNGDIVWEKETGFRVRDYLISSADEKLYIAGNGIICFNIINHQEEWKLGVENFGSKETTLPYPANIRGLSVYKGLLIIGLFQTLYTGHGEVPVLIGVDKNTRETKWKFLGQGFIQQIPVVKNDMIIFGGWDGYIYSVNPNSGEEIWKCYVGREWGTQILCTDSIAIVKGEKKRLAGININNGKIEWINEGIMMPGQSPVQLGENVVGICQERQIIFALETTTGKIMWSFKVPSKPYAISTDQRFVYVSTDDGLYCYDISKII